MIGCCCLCLIIGAIGGALFPDANTSNITSNSNNPTNNVNQNNTVNNSSNSTINKTLEKVYVPEGTEIDYYGSENDINIDGYEFCVVLDDKEYFIEKGGTADNKLANYLTKFEEIYTKSGEIEMSSDHHFEWVGDSLIYVKDKQGTTGDQVLPFTNEKPFTFTYEKGEVNGIKDRYIITDVWTGNGSEIDEFTS